MKRLLKICAALVAVLVIVVAAIVLFVDADRFRPLLERQLSQALGRTVTIGHLTLAVLSGGISASDLQVSEDPAFGQEPFLTAKSLDIGVDLGALIFSRKLNVRALTVDGGQVTLIQTQQGDWNISSLGGVPAGPAEATSPRPAPAAETEGDSLDMAVQLVRIANSTVRLVSGADRHEFHEVAFELRGFSPTAAMPFTLTAAGPGGGRVELTGEAGPIAKPDAAATPFNAKVSIEGLDLGASGFVDPASGMAGLLTLRGDTSSNGKTASVTGVVTIDQLKLSPRGKPAAHPVAANLALAHDLSAHKGNIARSELKLGGATAMLSGSYDLSSTSPAVNLKLDGPNMPLNELLAFLPALDVQLPNGATIDGGTVDLTMTSRGPMTSLNTSGAVQVEQAMLHYDLGAKMRVIQQLADLKVDDTTEISLLAANFVSNPSGTSVEDIQFKAPDIGQLTGQGTVSPNHDLDFKMKAVVKTGGAVAAALKQRGETTTVPFSIRGTSSNPSFSPDVKALANEKLQQAIRNPEGAVKNAVGAAQGVLDMFRKAPPKTDPQK